MFSAKCSLYHAIRHHGEISFPLVPAGAATTFYLPGCSKLLHTGSALQRIAVQR